MRLIIRQITDKVFTILTGTSVVLLTAVLLVVLGPMVWRGSKAVVFRDTLEFRKMQLDLYNRGNPESVKAENVETEGFRKVVYETIDKFKRGIDTEELTDRSKQIYRQFGKELRYKGIAGDDYQQIRSLARDIRDRLQAAFESNDKKIIKENIDYVLQYRLDKNLVDTAAAEFFTLAEDFLQSVENIDLGKRQQYAGSLKQVEDGILRLLGPEPGNPVPALTMDRYGATRWDMAQRLLDNVLWSEQWIEKQAGQPLVKVRVSRAEEFAGTKLEPLFGYVEDNLEGMLKPEFKFYWQYFIDDSTPGHYFGGVGPEILGTLLLTLLAMLFVFPLGVISAAYLVECASDNAAVRMIRMCINTLAGVPSIVFGLFGLAFFVLFFIPFFGGPSKPCILAASLTLAVLTLPVMIRASEEAIRSVPQTYKEASLGLGASRFRTFVKVTLPAALPGILTGVILSISRVAGETAPILFTGAVALGPLPKSLFDPSRTLSYGSYDIAVGDRLAMMVPHNQYGMVVTLVLLILCLNTIAIVLRARAFRRLRGH
ncbi:MAG: phosphate ABC transporter permease PstA [Sedimentisphaerales bacterium]|nr:phosphate ABC transporter permease PstA [Sedimentisphaerales bacterium]